MRWLHTLCCSNYNVVLARTRFTFSCDIYIDMKLIIQSSCTDEQDLHKVVGNNINWTATKCYFGLSALELLNAIIVVPNLKQRSQLVEYFYVITNLYLSSRQLAGATNLVLLFPVCLSTSCWRFKCILNRETHLVCGWLCLFVLRVIQLSQ